MSEDSHIDIKRSLDDTSLTSSNLKTDSSVTLRINDSTSTFTMPSGGGLYSHHKSMSGSTLLLSLKKHILRRNVDELNALFPLESNIAALRTLSIRTSHRILRLLQQSFCSPNITDRVMQVLVWQIGSGKTYNLVKSFERLPHTEVVSLLSSIITSLCSEWLPKGLKTVNCDGILVSVFLSAHNNANFSPSSASLSHPVLRILHFFEHVAESSSLCQAVLDSGYFDMLIRMYASRFHSKSIPFVWQKDTHSILLLWCRYTVYNLCGQCDIAKSVSCINLYCLLRPDSNQNPHITWRRLGRSDIVVRRLDSLWTHFHVLVSPYGLHPTVELVNICVEILEFSGSFYGNAIAEKALQNIDLCIYRGGVFWQALRDAFNRISEGDLRIFLLSYMHRLISPSLYILCPDEEDHDMFNSVDAYRFMHFAAQSVMADRNLLSILTDTGLWRVVLTLLHYESGVGALASRTRVPVLESVSTKEDLRAEVIRLARAVEESQEECREQGEEGHTWHRSLGILLGSDAIPICAGNRLRTQM